MPDRLVRPDEFARTYDSRAYADTWDLVQDYRRVLEYHASHPDHGRVRVGNALDLPPERVRGWINDAKPDAVHGLEAAEDRGWIDVDPDTSVFAGLNVLVAWIFSGGSILEANYAPYFAVADTDERARLDAAAELAGVELRLSRDREANRPDEATPTDAAPILGRVLSVLGAPIGRKNSERHLSLPPYLEAVRSPVRRDFVLTYVLNRGQLRDQAAILTLHEERREAYLSALADLIAGVLDERVRPSGENVIFSKAATKRLVELDPPLTRFATAEPDAE